METILFIAGTRPEAIKLAPVCKAIRGRGTAKVVLCSTGQHPELFRGALSAFGLKADIELAVMLEGQQLPQLMGRLMSELPQVISDVKPDIVVVQGDTASAVAGALCGFFGRARVAHIEAGLRTQNLDSPFPEEGNRQIISRVSHWHFAPTRKAADNLVAESIPESQITVTGNTIVDAVQGTAGTCPDVCASLSGESKVITVTCHRRENIGEGAGEVARGIVRLAEDFPETQFVVVLHPNPKVAGPLQEMLHGLDRVAVVPALGYEDFVGLLRRSWLLVTDSGGLQEEGVTLGVPVIIARDATERCEAVDAGAAILTGARADRIYAEVASLLASPDRHARMCDVRNPFGDGRAAERIADVLMNADARLDR